MQRALQLQHLFSATTGSRLNLLPPWSASCRQHSVLQTCRFKNDSRIEPSMLTRDQELQEQPNTAQQQPTPLEQQIYQMPSLRPNNSKSPWLLVCVPAALAVLAWCGAPSPALMAKQFWNFYLQMLQENPFGTKIATGMTGAFLGDLLAQAFPPLLARVQPASKQTAQPVFKYDVLRAARMVAFSAIVGTPIAHFWYTFLDSTISPGNPTAISTIATKVALDQLMLAPIMTSVFFVAMCAMEGKTHTAVDALKSKLIPTLKANYMLWPVAHCINFAFVPADQRILYINVVALLWTVILSTAQASPVQAAAKVQTQPSPVSARAKDL